MASQSGKNYVISFIEQTVIGTPVTGAGGTVLRTLASEGFSLNRASIVSQENRPDGMQGAPRKGVKSSPATFNCELSYGTFDGLFEAFLRSAAVAGVISPGTTKKFFTFDQYHQDIDLSMQIETVRPLSMAVNVPAEGMVGITWGLLGRDVTPLATGTSPGLTAPTLTTTEPMAGIDATITGPGSLQFSSASFSLNRGGGVQALIGTTLSPDIYDGSAVGEGTLSGTLEALTWLSTVIADTAVTLDISCPDAAGSIVEFALANVQLLNFAAPVGQDSAMIVSSRFVFGGANALVITNTP